MLAQHDAFLRGQRREIVRHHAARESQYVAIRRTELQMPAFHLAEIQHLAQQTLQPVDVAAQHPDLSLLGRILPLPIIPHTGDYAERREQLMGHVGEIIRLGPREFLLQPQVVHRFQPPEPEPQQHEKYPRHGKGVTGVCPRSLIPGRQARHPEQRHRLLPFPRPVRGLHFQPPRPLGQVLVIHRVLSFGQDDPIFVHPFQTAGITDSRIPGIVQRGKTGIQVAGIRAEHDMGTVRTARHILLRRVEQQTSPPAPEIGQQRTADRLPGE